jgi:hypothetical protein
VVVAIAIGLLIWRGLAGTAAGPRSSAADQPEPKPATVADDRLRLRSFRVLWYDEGEAPAARRVVEIGRDRYAANFGDGVSIEVLLSKPAYAYLLAFNTDGSEQRLWPADETIPPKQTAAVRFPAQVKDTFLLNDDPAGGVQGLVLVASCQPLPSYRAWRKARGQADWPARAEGRGVWSCDGAGVYPVTDGRVQRGDVREQRGVPALLPLCRLLRTEGVELVEGLAFPVAREEK